jgi:peptidoglycan hydrolase CwlO-like protein
MRIPEEFGGLITEVSASLLILSTVAVKLFRILRSDLRADRDGERDDRADKISQDVWEKTIQRLENLIEKRDNTVSELEHKLALVTSQVDELTKRVNVEMNMRYAAEGQARRAEYRILQLETEIIELKGGKGVTPANTAS